MKVGQLEESSSFTCLCKCKDFCFLHEFFLQKDFYLFCRKVYNAKAFFAPITIMYFSEEGAPLELSCIIN